MKTIFNEQLEAGYSSEVNGDGGTNGVLFKIPAGDSIGCEVSSDGGNKWVEFALIAENTLSVITFQLAKLYRFNNKSPSIGVTITIL